jgi:hypothetical protein
MFGLLQFSFPATRLPRQLRATLTPGSNPNKPELPELKGDFDWDAKFAADDDWLTENVPGKVVLSELELAAQVTALDKLEEKWRKQRQSKEYDAARLLGWTEQAEAYNGRYAMFFGGGTLDGVLDWI